MTPHSRPHGPILVLSSLVVLSTWLASVALASFQSDASPWLPSTVAFVVAIGSTRLVLRWERLTTPWLTAHFRHTLPLYAISSLGAAIWVEGGHTSILGRLLFLSAAAAIVANACVLATSARRVAAEHASL